MPLTLSPKQKVQNQKNKTVQSKAPNRVSRGEKSIIESDETFGEMITKPGVAVNKKVSEVIVGTKKHAFKTTNPDVNAVNKDTIDLDDGSITITTP